MASYKALTRLHLPVIERDYNPGELVTDEELEAAGQTDENIQALVNSGSLGGEDDDVHPSAIIPKPDMPTIGKAVLDAQEIKAQLEAAGEEVPEEVEVMANLDYHHAQADDEGKSGDASG